MSLKFPERAPVRVAKFKLIAAVKPFMKPLKLALFIVPLIVLGATTASFGNTITFLGEFPTANQDISSIVAMANANGGDTGVLPNDIDLVSGGRLGDNGGTLVNAFGTFTVTVVPNMTTGQTQFLTFTLNPGFVLAAVAIHAGSGQNDDLFAINDETAGVNEGPFHGPIAGGSGMFADLSNFDILVEEGQPRVPDSGATAALLGLGLIGLAAVRAKFRKA